MKITEYQKSIIDHIYSLYISQKLININTEEPNIIENENAGGMGVWGFNIFFNGIRFEFIDKNVNLKFRTNDIKYKEINEYLSKEKYITDYESYSTFNNTYIFYFTIELDKSTLNSTLELLNFLFL